MVRHSSEDEDSSSGRRGRRRYRHTPYQIHRLEEVFQNNQHPSDAQRSNLARELELTENQTKFWFQNRRTLAKAQAERDEGIALREENERLKIENMNMQKVLKNAHCSTCRMGQGHRNVMRQSRTENYQLNHEYEKLKKRFSTSESCPHNYAIRELLVTQMIGNNELVFPSKLQQAAFGNDNIEMIKVVADATAELSSLFAIDALWNRDPINGRCSINKRNYETYTSLSLSMTKTNSHMVSNMLHFESSKEQAIVKMNATTLVQMLMIPGMRHELFPTLIINTNIMQQMQTSAGIQLVYEQVHFPTPMVSPRDFYVLRYMDQLTEKSWVIVDVSVKGYHAFTKEDASTNVNSSGSLQWKLASGCFIQALSNGYSKVTWIEHVQANDSLRNNLYEDLVHGGFAYGAGAWVYTLQRTCLRLECEREGNFSNGGEVLGQADSMRAMMKLADRMVKGLCETLAMKHDVCQGWIGDSGSGINDIFITRRTGSLGKGDNRTVLSVATSIRLPLPPQVIYSFLTDLKVRATWDVLCAKKASQEIAAISYGNNGQNRISTIQPLSPYESNVVILQESFIDPERAVVVYAPIDIPCLDKVLAGGDSSNVKVLPSGFIISSDGHELGAGIGRNGASTSTAAAAATRPSSGGSLVTLAFQVVGDRDSSGASADKTEMERARTLVASAVKRIRTALNIEQ